MNKVVFICHGNLFRSPIAKVIYNSMAKDGSHAESFGLVVAQGGYEGRKLAEFPGLSVDVGIMKKHGMDTSQETCRQLRPADLVGVSKIIVMAEEAIPEWLKKYDYEYWEVFNPSFVTAEITEKAVVLLKDKIKMSLLK